MNCTMSHTFSGQEFQAARFPGEIPASIIAERSTFFTPGRMMQKFYTCYANIKRCSSLKTRKLPRHYQCLLFEECNLSSSLYHFSSESTLIKPTSAAAPMASHLESRKARHIYRTAQYLKELDSLIRCIK